MLGRENLNKDYYSIILSECVPLQVCFKQGGSLNILSTSTHTIDHSCSPWPQKHIYYNISLDWPTILHYFIQLSFPFCFVYVKFQSMASFLSYIILIYDIKVVIMNMTSVLKAILIICGMCCNSFISRSHYSTIALTYNVMYISSPSCVYVSYMYINSKILYYNQQKLCTI